MFFDLIMPVVHRIIRLPLAYYSVALVILGW